MVPSAEQSGAAHVQQVKLVLTLGAGVLIIIAVMTPVPTLPPATRVIKDVIITRVERSGAPDQTHVQVIVIVSVVIRMEVRILLYMGQ